VIVAGRNDFSALRADPCEGAGATNDNGYNDNDNGCNDNEND
jgi:hypothetical protein